MTSEASGNEKGHVENLVKRVQRTFLTPLPEVSSLAELNQPLERDCQRELDQPTRDPRGGESRTSRELFAEEKPQLQPLPPQPFAACMEVATRIDKFATVRFDNCSYSVPVEQAYQPRHYLPLLRRKPGLLHNGRPFQGEPFGPDFALLQRGRHRECSTQHAAGSSGVATGSERLTDREVQARHSKAVERRLQAAHFPTSKELADFQFAAVPQLNKRRVLDLARGEFISEKANVVLLGAPGVGKTHVAIGLAREERRILRLEASIARTDLIVVDELGYLPLIDRLTHRIHVVEMCGESYRLRQSLQPTSSPAKTKPSDVKANSSS